MKTKNKPILCSFLSVCILILFSSFVYPVRSQTPQASDDIHPVRNVTSSGVNRDQEPIREKTWIELAKKVTDAIAVVTAEGGSGDGGEAVKSSLSLHGVSTKFKSTDANLKGESIFIRPIFRTEEERIDDWPFIFRAPLNMGTGTIIHPQGFVLTNHHVVDGATQFRIILKDGRKFPADLIAIEPRYDAALLKIKTVEPMSFPYLTPHPLSEIQTGQPYLAVGHPFGLLFNSQTGIVSSPPPEKSLKIEVIDPNIVFRADGTYPPGSSGTPLITPKKKVLGIIFASIRQIHFPGLALAVEPIINHFVKNKHLPAIPNQ